MHHPSAFTVAGKASPPSCSLTVDRQVILQQHVVNCTQRLPTRCAVVVLLVLGESIAALAIQPVYVVVLLSWLSVLYRLWCTFLYLQESMYSRNKTFINGTTEGAGPGPGSRPGGGAGGPYSRQ
jgi:hypothetical protein